MKTVKAYYAKLNNMGDLLTEYLIPELVGYQVQHCENVALFDVMGVGSCGGALWANKVDGNKEKVKDVIKLVSCSLSRKPCAVWGTGFLRDYPDRKLVLVRKNVQFVAVRGKLSKGIIEKSLGKPTNAVTCDGGILASRLIHSRVEKKYAIGFIPHYNEHTVIKENGILEHFLSLGNNAIVINLRDDPMEVIKKIAQCEVIISSSLHGCVVADSFNIPNVRIQLSSIPGTGFKFDDYYSSYGLTIPPVVVRNSGELPDTQYIIDNYSITPEMVDEKKDEMQRSLVQFLSE